MSLLLSFESAILKFNFNSLWKLRFPAVLFHLGGQSAPTLRIRPSLSISSVESAGEIEILFFVFGIGRQFFFAGQNVHQFGGPFGAPFGGQPQTAGNRAELSLIADIVYEIFGQRGVFGIQRQIEAKGLAAQGKPWPTACGRS